MSLLYPTERGRNNFVELYSPIADRWIAYDNSQQIQKIAEKPLNQLVTIYQPQRKATNSYQLIMNNSIPDKLSTICDSLFQKAVDEALEQHRIKGESIALEENGQVKIIPPEEITPLADKLKQREAHRQQIHHPSQKP